MVGSENENSASFAHAAVLLNPNPNPKASAIWLNLKPLMARFRVFLTTPPVRLP